MAEAIGDNVFDVESDEDYLHLSSDTPDTPIVDVSDISIVDENIQKILILTDPGDIGVEFNEDMGDDNAKELVSGPELYLSSS